jgi:hypothetical protein
MARRDEHYRHGYDRQAAAVRAAADADPATVCWQCGRTKREHRREWTAGHEHDGVIGSRLLPECAGCNYSRGATLANQRRLAGGLQPTRPR